MANESKYDEVKKAAHFMIECVGSDVKEREDPGSKAEFQASQIAEFISQWDVVTNFIQEHDYNMIAIKQNMQFQRLI